MLRLDATRSLLAALRTNNSKHAAINDDMQDVSCTPIPILHGKGGRELEDCYEEDYFSGSGGFKLDLASLTDPRREMLFPDWDVEVSPD